MTELVEHGQLFIGGELTDPLGKDVIEVISPHTEEVIGRVPHASRGGRGPGRRRRAPGLRRGTLAADDASTSGSRSSPGSRTRIAVRHEEIARVISSENGSPYSWSVLAQALGAMMVWDSAITVARDFTYEETRDGVLGRILVRREPVGVVAAVVPWNVPQFVAAAKLAPALLTGCTVVLKPSPESPLDAYLLGGDREGGRAAGGRPVDPPGRPRGQRVPGRAPGHRQGLL